MYGREIEIGQHIEYKNEGTLQCKVIRKLKIKSEIVDGLIIKINDNIYLDIVWVPYGYEEQLYEKIVYYHKEDDINRFHSAAEEFDSFEDVLFKWKNKD